MPRGDIGGGKNAARFCNGGTEPLCTLQLEALILKPVSSPLLGSMFSPFNFLQTKVHFSEPVSKGSPKDLSRKLSGLGVWAWFRVLGSGLNPSGFRVLTSLSRDRFGWKATVDVAALLQGRSKRGAPGPLWLYLKRPLPHLGSSLLKGPL